VGQSAFQMANYKQSLAYLKCLVNLVNGQTVWRVRAKQVGKCRRVWQVRHISEKDHFGKFEYSPKMVNFWQVLEFAKFTPEWPFLNL
jgi:hypothetical protein